MVIEQFKTEYDEMNRMRKLSGLSLIIEEYYYNNVLTEDKRYDWLYDNYKNKFFNKYKSKWEVEKDDNEIIKTIKLNLNELIKKDPTSKIENNQVIKTGKYSQWIVKQYLEDKTNRFFEDLYKITNDLKIFDKIKHKLPEDKRDINLIKTPFELYELIKPYRELDIRTKSEKKGDIETLYNDNNYHILIPKTKEAACTYGEGTRWCTASPGLTYFESYTSRGPLYIIIHKKEENEKYQFHFEDNQFMDINDSSIDLKKYLEDNPIVKEVFKNKFIKEKNVKNLIDIDEVRLAFKISKGVLSKFDATATLKLYKEKLVSDESMNKKWKNSKTEIFKNGNLYYVTDDWCDESLSELFHSDYQDFAKKLLCGDAYDTFQYYDYTPELNNYWNDINKENLKEIQKLSIGLTTNGGIKITNRNIKKYSTNIKQDNGLYELVDNNEDWSDIKREIENAITQEQGSLDEGVYWNAYTKLITDKIGSSVYNKKNNKLYFKIDGYEDWAKSFQETHPDEDIYSWGILNIIREVLNDMGELIRPRNEYYGSWDDKYFNEILSDKLSELK